MNLVDLPPSHGMFFSENDHKTLGFRCLFSATPEFFHGPLRCQVQLITSKPTALALDWAILSRPAELVPSVNGHVSMVAVPVELVFVWGSFVDHLLDQQEVFCYVLHCLWWFFLVFKE